MRCESAIFCTISADIFRLLIFCWLACMGGCLGSGARPTLITAADDPPKELRSQGQTAKKHSMDLWTASACEMDNRVVYSQDKDSVTSISTSNQSVSRLSNNPSEFVNHGFLLWNQTRQHWLKNKKSKKQAQQDRESKLNWNATYDSLFGSNKPFPRPIPLSEMVDFLVDIWEQEGMYS